VEQEFEFFRPKEVVGIEAFFCEAFGRCEVGQACWEQQKQEKGISRYVADVLEVFRESCRNWSNPLGNLFVFEYKGSEICQQNWWELVVGNGMFECRQRQWCSVND
jgi:hypothetical protein